MSFWQQLVCSRLSLFHVLQTRAAAGGTRTCRSSAKNPVTNGRGDWGAVQFITTIAMRLWERFKFLFFPPKILRLSHATSPDRHPVVHPERVIVTIVVRDNNNNNNNWKHVTHTSRNMRCRCHYFGRVRQPISLSAMMVASPLPPSLPKFLGCRLYSLKIQKIDCLIL